MHGASCCSEAGLPDGVFNVVQGDKVAVDALLEHPDVKAVSFVGSTPIAAVHLRRRGARHGKRVQALGGAKNHLVVMPDADLEQAVDALIGAAYGSAGERCMAISVAVLVGDVADRLVPKLAARAQGAEDQRTAWSPTPKWGRSSPAGARAHRGLHRRRRASEGAKLVVDGRGLTVPGHEERLLHRAARCSTTSRPTCASTARRSSARCCACVRVPDFAAAVELINAHEFGNGVSLLHRATATSRASSAAASRSAWSASTCRSRCRWPGTAFGGWKRSLFGDMHAYGEEGVRFYTRQKSIMQRWPQSIAKGAEFTMPVAK